MKKSISFLVFISLFTLIFLALGTWQLCRKAEKETFLKALALSQQQSPVNIDESNFLPSLSPVYAEGNFVPGKTIFLQAKTHHGKAGIYVIDLFKTKGGKYFLVQRGWSSREISSPPKSFINVEGILRTPSLPTVFQPANQKPTYFWIDIKTMSQDLDVPLQSNYIVAKTSNDPRILPTQPFPAIANHHLQYAITWYSLAIFLFCVLLWRNKLLWKKDS